MRKGLVIVRSGSITGKKQGSFSEYEPLTSDQVVDFDSLVENGFVKEFDTYADVLAFINKVGLKKEVKNIWGDTAKAPVLSLAEKRNYLIEELLKNDIEPLQIMLKTVGYTEGVNLEWTKGELANRIADIKVGTIELSPEEKKEASIKELLKNNKAPLMGMLKDAGYEGEIVEDDWTKETLANKIYDLTAK